MKIHFISIGGSVMHQLAIALKRKGYEITGSDDEIFEPALGNLLKEGILPTTNGWDAERVNSTLDAIILGMHARADNPELARAKELQLPVYSFPEYIFQESQHKNRIVVGGSHGKTTTTSMIMHVLKEQNLEFDYLVGARLEGFDQSVKITNAPLIVCEGDEYPASVIEKRPKFHFLYPHIAVLTGIAWDHINVFPTFDNYLDQFRIFIQKITPGGVLIYNKTDQVLDALVSENPREDIRYMPYGIPSHEISQGVSTVRIENNSMTLKVFGNHNLLNLHAAWLVCQELKISSDNFLKAISDFTGAAKRLEKMAGNDSLVFYRDFAHAPSKVKATIEAVQLQFPTFKIVALLELHTYSSLNEQFMKEYQGAMAKADIAAVFYSSHALELKRMPPLLPEKVKEGFSREDLSVITDKESLNKWLNSLDLKNSVTVFMSSGNYDGLDIAAFAEKMVEQAD